MDETTGQALPDGRPPGELLPPGELVPPGELLPPGELRKVARVVLLDPDDRILLLHGYEPADPALNWWFTPGGGVEDGETREQAALRELAEETGITDVDLGPVVWRRICSFPFDGRQWNQDEWYYLARTGHTTAALGTDLTELEARSVTGLRWWTSAELSAARETVYPTRLAELLRTLLDDGPPRTPLVLSPEIVQGYGPLAHNGGTHG
ncbi:NUDIX hydrolase [Streptomyces sp. TRM64462]|uniref:NUDIX hydrolase n=1 Tax=Streptomyces sp. TRM64462 TaxID=2741726 RepID=UPI0015860F0E|nr:NUDIX hydrolase [Streptomyces sp. TRM64462]